MVGSTGCRGGEANRGNDDRRGGSSVVSSHSRCDCKGDRWRSWAIWRGSWGNGHAWWEVVDETRVLMNVSGADTQEEGKCGLGLLLIF